MSIYTHLLILDSTFKPCFSYTSITWLKSVGILKNVRVLRKCQMRTVYSDVQQLNLVKDQSLHDSGKVHM